MIASLLRKFHNTPSNLSNSQLFNESSFYANFTKDLAACSAEVIIESPFVTTRRLMKLLPTLSRLKSKHVKIVVNTRDPYDQESVFARADAYKAIGLLLSLGIQVIYTSGHHRKLAVLDRKILYEGSLNILSQNNSQEVMRRVESVRLAWQMIGFAKLDKLIS